jgi:hypothetical protein
MFYDFVEIGTSDFNTLIEIANDTATGLSIDPILVYLDNLPNRKGCKKINAAVSNYNGKVNVYYIEPKTITEHKLPEWVRGCNSVGVPHPTIVSMPEAKKLIINKVVPAYTLDTLLSNNKASGMYYLKIDTESHDAVIINCFFDESSRMMYPHKLLFESNCLSNNDDVQRLISRLILAGYDLISCQTGGGDTDTMMRLNLNRLRNKIGFTKSISGYYLGSYPLGYIAHDLPHDNTLEDAMKWCIKNKCTGVTYQYERYEVRCGNYLNQHHDKNIKSWVYI